ncbi:endonuclease domain-containing protein [Micromonospora sp. NPDC000442]|uniref:endonuclease domain-containing protein n=1 Tax=Micromonospora sp. NPDC000442 TaxID=3364217 RepID=UPI0036896CA2
MAAQLWRVETLLRTLTARRLRTRLGRDELLRVRRGVYADQLLDDEDELRALLLCLPEGAMFTRQTAARRYGFGVLRDDLVHVHLPATVPKPRLPGLVVHRSVLPVQPVLVNGLPCVPAARCAVDLARTVRRLDALPVLDCALRSGLVTPDDLMAEVCKHRALRGVRQARELVPLADGRSECRQESQLRLVLLDGRLPPPEPQLWVHDAEGFQRYRLDLGYRERRVGIEYDGVSHLDRESLRYDRERVNWLDAQGWRMRYFTDRDLYRRPNYIVATIRTALS